MMAWRGCHTADVCLTTAGTSQCNVLTPTFSLNGNELVNLCVLGRQLLHIVVFFMDTLCLQTNDGCVAQVRQDVPP